MSRPWRTPTTSARERRLRSAAATAALALSFACGGDPGTGTASIVDAFLLNDSTLRLYTSVCGAEYDPAVVETADEVRVRLRYTNAGGCEALESVEVGLERPMANRSLVDEATGEAVAIGTEP